jgi:hypothetical protein
MKKTKIQDINDNSLNELTNLIWDIMVKVGQYSHVSQHLPKSLIKEIDKFNEILTNEYKNRND